jgi:hypothetical protein
MNIIPFPFHPADRFAIVSQPRDRRVLQQIEFTRREDCPF